MLLSLYTFKISHNKNLLFKRFDNNVSNYKYLVFFQVIFPPGQVCL